MIKIIVQHLLQRLLSNIKCCQNLKNKLYMNNNSMKINNMIVKIKKYRKQNHSHRCIQQMKNKKLESHVRMLEKYKKIGKIDQIKVGIA
jgi:hypothetical protein